MATDDSIKDLFGAKIVKGKKYGSYAGIMIILFFLVLFIPSALSQAEWTAGIKARAGVGTHTGGADPAGPIKGGMTLTGIGVGTIAMGTAIAEAAAVAVAASQTSQSNSTTIH